MNKKIKILIIIVLILILAWLTVFIVDYNRCSNMKEPLDNQEEIPEDIVKIINGKIENENLIDEFMNETANKQDKTLKIEIIKDGITKNVEVSFVANPGKQLDDNTQRTEIRIWLL